MGNIPIITLITFSNIDNPDTFLNEFSKLIESNDYFLIDASVLGDNYALETDESSRLKNEFASKLCLSSIKQKYESSGIFKKSNKVNELFYISGTEIK